MYVIKIFCDFCISEKCKENYEKIYRTFENDKYGQNKKVYFTNEDVYTHAIIINQTMPPNLMIPKKNVIGLAFEPRELMNFQPEFIDYAKKYIGKYYIGTKSGLQEPFVEGFGYMWFADPGRNISFVEKPKIMSIILSEKQFAPGHQYRHQLVNCILQNKIPVDVYGRGANIYKNIYPFASNIKGTFDGEIPYEEYAFSICIENFSNNHYFSEKIMSPLMHNCMPIYWGCVNILSYFDEVLLLSGDLQMDMNFIVDILKNPHQYHKQTYTQENRKKINLIENIDSLF